jgi:hypothetical protein
MFEDARKRLWVFTAMKKSRTKRFTLTVPEGMAVRLEEERKKRLLDTIPETVRIILSERLMEQRS